MENSIRRDTLDPANSGRLEAEGSHTAQSFCTESRGSFCLRRRVTAEPPFRKGDIPTTKCQTGSCICIIKSTEEVDSCGYARISK